MGSAAETTNGLATPPRLPAAKPLVYITGSPTANTQCVAEYLALLLGDEAILIDQPSASARTPPPPSSTPPTSDPPAVGSSSTTRQQRPRNIRLPPRSRSASIATTIPPTAGSSSSDRMLATLTSHPHRTAILTDGHSPTSTPFQAASQTGRPLVSVRLQPHTTTASEPVPSTETPAPPQHNTNDPYLLVSASAVLALPDSHADPHAAALRIAAFVREMNARRRSHGDWDAVNYDSARDLRGNVGGGDSGGGGGGGQGEYACGVITPVLTPAEEREIRF